MPVERTPEGEHFREIQVFLQDRPASFKHLVSLHTAKELGLGAQLLECLPSMDKALGPISSTS